MTPHPIPCSGRVIASPGVTSADLSAQAGFAARWQLPMITCRKTARYHWPLMAPSNQHAVEGGLRQTPFPHHLVLTWVWLQVPVTCAIDPGMICADPAAQPLCSAARTVSPPHPRNSKDRKSRQRPRASPLLGLLGCQISSGTSNVMTTGQQSPNLGFRTLGPGAFLRSMFHHCQHEMPKQSGTQSSEATWHPSAAQENMGIFSWVFYKVQLLLCNCEVTLATKCSLLCSVRSRELSPDCRNERQRRGK